MEQDYYKIREINKHTTPDSFEIKLFTTDRDSDGPYGIRVRDLDAKENISITFCTSKKMAEKVYEKAVKDFSI